jgi:hypothetical protein
MVHHQGHVTCTTQKLKRRTESRHNFNIVNTAHTAVFSVGVVSGFRIIKSELEYYGICGLCSPQSENLSKDESNSL